MNRDQSKDIQILDRDLALILESETFPTHCCAVRYVEGARVDDVDFSWVHYVPRSDLAASESRERGAQLELTAIHSRADALERQNLGLHNKVAELSARIRELEAYSRDANQETERLQGILNATNRFSDSQGETIKELKAKVRKLERSVSKGPPFDEPGLSAGFVFCTKEEATEATFLDTEDEDWCDWSPISDYCFYHRPERYRFQRPVANWVACTHREALDNGATSQWLLNSEWVDISPIPQGNPDPSFAHRYAYRTTAKLSEWVTVSVDVWRDVVNKHPSVTRDLMARTILRDGVPVGTVLG